MRKSELKSAISNLKPEYYLNNKTAAAIIGLLSIASVIFVARYAQSRIDLYPPSTSQTQLEQLQSPDPRFTPNIVVTPSSQPLIKPNP